MHPDEAVQLALQDLRSRGLHVPPPASEPARAFTLLHAYLRRLSWYVEDGRTPAADDGAAVGHLPRPRFTLDDAADAADAALAPLAMGVGR